MVDFPLPCLIAGGYIISPMCFLWFPMMQRWWLNLNSPCWAHHQQWRYPQIYYMYTYITYIYIYMVHRQYIIKLRCPRGSESMLARSLFFMIKSYQIHVKSENGQPKPDRLIIHHHKHNHRLWNTDSFKYSLPNSSKNSSIDIYLSFHLWIYLPWKNVKNPFSLPKTWLVGGLEHLFFSTYWK